MSAACKPTALVPPILSAFATTLPAWAVPSRGNSWDAATPELKIATNLACNECEQLTSHALRVPYPQDPTLPFWRRSTINGPTQLLRRAVGLYKDDRTLAETDILTRYSAFGSLTAAVERARGRHLERGEGGVPRLLEIGAGQRLVAAGLKAMHGDRIAMEEISPQYASLKGVFDLELPSAQIDDAVIGEDRYELIYSFYGSVYGDDQLKILQKVVAGLKVGGEASLMWKCGWRHNAMAKLVRRHAAFFQQGGLDLSVSSLGISADGGPPEAVHTIWARKRAESVDVAGLFARAKALDRDAAPPELPSTLRLSSDGPYFHMNDFLLGDLERIVDEMVIAAGFAMGLEPRRLESCFRVRPGDAHLGQGRLASGTALAYVILSRVFLERHWRDDPSPLAYHEPLSYLVLDYLHQADPVLRLGSSYVRERGLIYYYYASMRH